MRVSSRAVATATMLVSLVSPRATCAQQIEPATIPTVLATALVAPFTSMFGKQPHFVLAHTPDGWPTDLSTSAPATLVGGFSLGPLHSAIYRYPRRVDAVKAYERVLAGAGFTRGMSMDRPHGGFTSEAPREMPAWCRNDGSVTVTVVDSNATTRSLLVTYVSDRETFGPCAPPPSPSESWKPPLEIPSLTAPSGVTASAGGTGWSGENMRTSVNVDTTISADSLLEHYARQLAAAGWQMGKRLSDGSTALQPLSFRDARGKEWVGALTLIMGADSRTVTLNVMPAISERAP